MAVKITVSGMKNFHVKLNSIMDGMPHYIGMRTVELFKDNIEDFNPMNMGGGWVMWKNPGATAELDQIVYRGGRHSLLLRTRTLENSINLYSFTKRTCTIEANTPYSTIQHEGGIITQIVSDKQRKFFWAMYYQTNNNLWKALALKKTITIEIPSRPFMEINNNVMNEIQNYISDYISKF